MISVSDIEFFTLVFIRVVSALAVLPVFGHAAIPSTLKAATGGVIALLLVPVIPHPSLAADGTVIDFMSLGLREAVCGVLIGFVGHFLFYGVEVAGQLIGFQSGFSMVASIDPNTEVQSTVITQFYNVFAMLLFLSFNGHHLLLQGLAESFRAIPVGALHTDGRLAQWLTDASQGVLVNGVRFAAPIMISLLLADVGLGILTRIAPTLNIFVLGFPLKIAVTVILVGATLAMGSSLFTSQYRDFVRMMPVFQRILVAP